LRQRLQGISRKKLYTTRGRGEQVDCIILQLYPHIPSSSKHVNIYCKTYFSRASNFYEFRKYW